jgi:hypothetical protein
VGWPEKPHSRYFHRMYPHHAGAIRNLMLPNVDYNLFSFLDNTLLCQLGVYDSGTRNRVLDAARLLRYKELGKDPEEELRLVLVGEIHRFASLMSDRLEKLTQERVGQAKMVMLQCNSNCAGANQCASVRNSVDSRRRPTHFAQHGEEDDRRNSTSCLFIR